MVDFTDVNVKDILVNKLADEDIFKEVLGLESLDNKNENETTDYIECKDMERDASFMLTPLYPHKIH